MADRKAKAPQLSLIILNYQTNNLVLDLLKSLGKSDDAEIIIVDNSPDDSLKSLLPAQKNLKYVHSESNLGFAGGNNLGVKHASSDWICFLNSDTLTTISEIKSLKEIAEENQVLVAAPKLVGKSGKVQNNVGNFDPLHKDPVNYLLARPHFLDCSHIDKTSKVDLLTGAVMLIHRSVFEKVGLLDDKNFFMYFEDIDFSYRLHRSNISVLYVPEIIVMHFGGESSDQNPKQKNLNYQRGLVTYLTKHRGPLISLMNNYLHLFR